MPLPIFILAIPRFLLRVFDQIAEIWQGHVTSRVISTVLILTFFTGLGLAAVAQTSLLALPQYGYFISIDIAFTVLLIFEILGLVFVLPRSVADAMGKQFEILSIILLRAAFKEFGLVDEPLELKHLGDPSFYPMFADAFGALLIFMIIGFYYQIQKHERITGSKEEQFRFIALKKIVALGMLIVFAALGIRDIWHLLQSGRYEHSFNIFYLVLIFADIIILLYSLRFTTRYFNIFRYSSFAFATILIRMALSAGPYINVILGVIAGLFVLGLSYLYNHFREKDLGIEEE